MAYIMRGRWQAISSVIVLAMVSLVLMPLSWPLAIMSAAVIGLVTLVQGPKEGILCLLIAALLMGVVGMVLLGNPVVAIGFGLLIWLPVWLLSLVLVKTTSLNLSVLLSAAVGTVFILLLYAILGDPAEWWYQHFVNDVIPALEKAGMVLNDKPALEANLRPASKLMPGVMGVFIVVGAYLGLFLARRWQAVLYNPGGFQAEFYRLRLGKIAAITGLLLLAISSIVPGLMSELAMNLFQLMVVVFLLQGLAVGHVLVKSRSTNTAWLVVLYILLFFVFPYGLLLIALTGLMDNWVNLRQRFAKPTSNI
ncbi:MAG: YybS family protein [Gammaproteobacteria bacterium]|nr:YybS family protein [Gammaproteobacteria bacterium]